MTMQSKAICLCLHRRHRRLLCYFFKILKIRHLLAPFAAWPLRQWRCNKPIWNVGSCHKTPPPPPVI
jgi:hypothetical protein